MLCYICNEKILANNAKALIPCCKNSVHTLCLLTFTDDHYLNNKHEVICNCGEILLSFKQPVYIPFETEEEVLEKLEPRMSQLTFKKATLETRKKVREHEMAFNDLKRFVNEQYTIFKNDIFTYLNTIKTIRNEALDKIKQSEEYKNNKTKNVQASRSINKMVHDFGLTEREANIHCKRKKYRYNWYLKTNNVIRRKFRIRIF